MSRGKANSSQVSQHAHCLNCAAPLHGKYCSQCGQNRSVHVLSLRELFHELAEVLFRADSKLWRTLRLMAIKPGEVSAEFVRGRRPRKPHTTIANLFGCVGPVLFPAINNIVN